MHRERRPEHIQRIDNLLARFFLNPYSILSTAAKGRIFGLVTRVAVLRLPCGALVDSDVEVLLVAGPGYYRELYPKTHSVPCPACGELHIFDSAALRQAVTDVDDAEFNCGRTAELCLTAQSYQDHAAAHHAVDVA